MPLNLQDEYRTHNAVHSKFDDMILAFALLLKIIIFFIHTIR